jgi:hypothetical protein
MELHQGARFLHIGCDEVFQMGECRRCRSQMRETLFLSHVARVASYVRNRYGSVTPIIWDDMLRHLSTQGLDEFHIGELVEPMVSYSFLEYADLAPLSLFSSGSNVRGTRDSIIVFNVSVRRC